MTDNAPAPLEFWFEFASSYSYPAAARVGTLAEAAGVPVLWRPFLLGPIFAAQGWSDSPFNLYPAKGRYMWRDLERICQGRKLPFRHPSEFPRSGLLAARLAVLAAEEGWCGAFAPAVYRANFAEDRDIADPEVIAGVLSGVRRDADNELARALLPETKRRLREQSERAIALGLFGAPTAVVAGELFWGDDRLEQAIEWAVRGPRKEA